MKVKALRNIISTNTDYGIITAGDELDVKDDLAKSWIQAGTVEKVKIAVAEKKGPPVKEKAVKPPKAETREK